MRQKMLSLTVFLLVAGLVSSQQTEVGGYNITLSKDLTHPIPKLYGMMYEDINHSGDGGYYAEMLRNRALQAKHPKKHQKGALEAWGALGGVKLQAVDLSHSGPLSQALPNALEVTILAGQTGAVLNYGYWGMKIDKNWVYTASFYAKMNDKEANSCGPKLSIQLITEQEPRTKFVDQPITSCLGNEWQKFEVKIQPSASARNVHNAFAIQFTSTSQSDEVVQIAFASLFPPTFNDRPNGVRIDLAETTASLKRTFFRWGGNNIEGFGPNDRWLWNRTIGPLIDRPGRLGNWGYVNTDGFGLLEVLQFCEDLNMEFIASVWSGLSLSPFKSVPEAEIGQYIQEGIDMLNFIVGPESTPQGALRANLGHPEPFKVRYVEVGNEDFFAKETYGYRWKHLAPPLMEAFPQLKFIATTEPQKPELDPQPFGWDIHSYNDAEFYATRSQDYDSFPRNGQKIFQLEFAANEKLGKAPIWPSQDGAVSEATYMIGFERNSDIVEGIAYAPMLCNTQVTEASQWHPNLIGFDALQVYPTYSYYVQKMFANFLGEKYLPSNLPPKEGPVVWSATGSSADQTIFVKISNYAKDSQKVTITLPFTPASQADTYTLAATADANLDYPTTDPIVNGRLATKSKTSITYTVEAKSVTAIVFRDQGTISRRTQL